MRKIIKFVSRLLLGCSGYDALRRFIRFRRDKKELARYYGYDLNRFLDYSGVYNRDGRDALQFEIIATYHVVEKGLTMPNRRFVFGKEVVGRLMDIVNRFNDLYGDCDAQVGHAVSVVTEYWKQHDKLVHETLDEMDADFAKKLSDFVDRHGNKIDVSQMHTTKEEFYRHKMRPFDRFAHARHTLRHYSDKELSIERITKAVEIACSTPSACNRQYCRVHCISDKAVISRILEIQNGNRGFGHLANKLLLVTADLEGVLLPQERNDLYTNGGMFLMNLCYGLYFNEIAHCILNWSRTGEEDMELRRLVPMKASESIIAVLSCGETPDEFDVAASPKKSVNELLVIH